MDKAVMNSRIFRRGRAFAYLEDQDRFLTDAPAPEFKFGFIGCGMMGQEHIHNALLLGRAEIGGIYDPTPKSVEHTRQMLEKSHPGVAPKVYQTLEEACADPDTDTLVVATPNFTHLEIMRVAARYDKAIFLEKPIATTVADAYEVCRLATQHSRPVRFGLQYRYKAIYADAITEVITQGSLGQVHSVNMLEHRFPFLDKVGQWNKFNAYTGGVLVEKCCHYFDLMNLFASSKPQQVFAVGHQAVNFRNFSYANKPADGIDQAQVTVHYENGVIGGFSLCMFVPGTREELVVCGDAGRLQVSEQAQLGHSHENQMVLWSGENGASRTSVPAYPPYIERAGHQGSTFFEHAAFADELAGEPPTGPTIADGFWSVMVGAAAQLSIEHAKPIEVADLLPPNFDESVLGEASHEC